MSSTFLLGWRVSGYRRESGKTKLEITLTVPLNMDMDKDMIMVLNINMYLYIFDPGNRLSGAWDLLKGWGWGWEEEPPPGRQDEPRSL